MSNVFSSDCFTWLRDGRKLVTESSDLGMKPGYVFEAIYNDACDQGMFVRSKKTGKLAVFALENEVRDKEGDVVCWEFGAVRPHQSMFRFGELASYREYEKLRVVVFND